MNNTFFSLYDFFFYTITRIPFYRLTNVFRLPSIGLSIGFAMHTMYIQVLPYVQIFIHLFIY